MMQRKLGRPSDNPKNYMLRVRMDEETLQKLDNCAMMLEMSRSQAVRMAIRLLEQQEQQYKT